MGLPPLIFILQLYCPRRIELLPRMETKYAWSSLNDAVRPSSLIVIEGWDSIGSKVEVKSIHLMVAPVAILSLLTYTSNRKEPADWETHEIAYDPSPLSVIVVDGTFSAECVADHRVEMTSPPVVRYFPLSFFRMDSDNHCLSCNRFLLSFPLDLTVPCRSPAWNHLPNRFSRLACQVSVAGRIKQQAGMLLRLFIDVS